MKLARWTVISAVLMLSASSAFAGSIVPPLQAEMDRSAPGTVFSVIVNMKEQTDVPTLSQQLEARHATLAERHAAVITALQASSRSQEFLRNDIEPELASGAVLGYTSYWISNLMVVNGTKEAIERIAARSDVDVVEPNFRPELIKPVSMGLGGEGKAGTRGIGVTPGLRAIHAPEVWYRLGYNGAGRLIGGLDTGVDGTHPALGSRWRGAGGQVPWQQCWLDLLGTNTTFPNDGYGHGTHTMGTMTGLGAGTQDTVGVAWGAKWIACNAINQGVGSEFDNDVITAFQWFADPDGNPNTTEDVPDVVQNSWRINEGFGGGYTDCDTRWWNVIDNCEAAGVAVNFSAGNEGPGAHTIGSPPDRATTIYNAFAIGAVDATDYSWPYPIADFSSRGPSGCTGVPEENKIKPEVVAPGVNVYSSIPGGGYDQNWSGTSMAGPHVSGIVPLLRQANPNLSVEDIKHILISTARDEGPAGEENTYGWGFVDAYAAVIQATVGFGQIQGHVTNGSWQNLAISGATVTLLENGTHFTTDGNGFFSGSAPAGTYHVEARHPAFRPDTLVVVLTNSQMTTQDFSLIDDRGPSFSNVYNPGTTTDPDHPFIVSATISDPSTVSSATLHYRVNGNGWIDVAMRHQLGEFWNAPIPPHSLGTRIDYYLSALDGVTNSGVSPDGAPATFYTYYVTTPVYSYNCENDDTNWTLYTSGDNAGTTGRWVRVDPNGTSYNGHTVQTEDDHTPNPAHICFVTGDGAAGSPPDAYDVDNGCTTLTSATVNLAGASHAFVTYWWWWAQEINADDQFQIDASSNGGTSWTPLERIPGNHESWNRSTIDLSSYIALTNNVKVRFKACDLGQAGIVEAAIDDFSIETYSPSAADVAGGTVPPTRNELAQNEPNPFNPVTTIKFTLSNPAQARIQIFEASGRLVRTLSNEPMVAGAHAVEWNGLDDSGKPVGSGVYFYRLKAGAFEQSRRMTILK